ncbi:MAG: hypothetical protein ACM3JB_14615 [Acidobacteriaceae bacterium]
MRLLFESLTYTVAVVGCDRSVELILASNKVGDTYVVALIVPSKII